MKKYADFQAPTRNLLRARVERAALLAAFAACAATAHAQVPEAPATPPMKGAAAASSQAKPTALPPGRAGAPGAAPAGTPPPGPSMPGPSVPGPVAGVGSAGATPAALRPSLPNNPAASNSAQMPNINAPMAGGAPMHGGGPAMPAGGPGAMSPGGARDPFAAPGNVQAHPSVAPPTMEASMPGATPEAQPAQKLNLDCINTGIKEQGKFVGKVQNKLIYKLGAQYCFEAEEPAPAQIKKH